MADLGIGEALAIAGTAASLAGTGASLYGNAQATSKENDAINSQISAQEALQRKASPIVDANIAASTAPKAQQSINDNAAATLSKYQGAQAVPLSTAPPSTPISTLTNTREKAEVGNSNAAASQLAGYGGWQTDQSIQNQKVGNDLGIIGSLSANEAAGLPLQLQQAAQSQAGWQAAGSILSGLGNAGMVYGAVNPSGGAGIGGTTADPYGNNWGPGWTNSGGPLEGTVVPG